MTAPDSPVGGRRTRRGVDEVVLSGFALGKSRSEIAALAGVAPRTVQRFLADPANRAEAVRRRREQEEAALGALRSALRRAAETLAALLEPEHPAAVRLRAAAELLASFRGMADHVDLQERLTQLEQRVEERAGAPVGPGLRSLR